MASVLTKLAATPYSLKYGFTATDDANAVKSRAAVIADCSPGPLATLLTQTTIGADWAALPFGVLLSLYCTGLDAAGGGQFVWAMFDATPQLIVSSEAAVLASAAVVEIRFHWGGDR